MHRTPARLVTALLLLASAAAFAAGVATERFTAGGESHATEQHADADAHTTPAVGPAAATPSAHALPVPAAPTNAVTPARRPTRGGDGDNGEAGTASSVEATPGSDEHSAPPRPAQNPATTPQAATSRAGSVAGDGDTGEPAANREPAARGETGTAHAAESQSEKLFGVNPEATGLVVMAVALSLLLAALILTVRSPLVPAGVAAAMLAFTVLDVREVTHQLTESRPGLAALAAAIALLHLLTAASALLVARAARSRAG